MGLNFLKINSLIKDIEDYILKLKSFMPFSENDLEKDIKLQFSVAFGIEQITNECINLGNHLISSLDFEQPTTFTSIFVTLQRNKVISLETSNKLQEFVQVRNEIAHRYGKVTNKELVVKSKELPFIKKFIEEILVYIKKLK